MAFGLYPEIGVFPDQCVVFVHGPQITVKDIRIPYLSDASDMFVFFRINVFNMLNRYVLCILSDASDFFVLRAKQRVD